VKPQSVNSFIVRRKKEEGRRKKEEGRGKKEEGRRKKEKQDLRIQELPERIGLKPEPFEGEIKTRLFIASILFLPGRGSCQLSTVNCQLNGALPTKKPGFLLNLRTTAEDFRKKTRFLATRASRTSIKTKETGFFPESSGENLCVLVKKPGFRLPVNKSYLF